MALQNTLRPVRQAQGRPAQGDAPIRQLLDLQESRNSVRTHINTAYQQSHRSTDGCHDLQTESPVPDLPLPSLHQRWHCAAEMVLAEPAPTGEQTVGRTVFRCENRNN